MTGGRETTVGELTDADYGKTITFTHQTTAMRPGPHHVHTDTGVLARIETVPMPGGLSDHLRCRVWVEGRDGYWAFTSGARCVIHG